MLIEIRPRHATHFILAHCRRNGKSNQPPDRNLLSFICLKGRYEPIKFVLCRPPVTFNSLANQTKPPERDARQVDALRRNKYSVDSCSMREDRFDIAQIDTQSDRAGTFASSLLAELD